MDSHRPVLSPQKWILLSTTCHLLPFLLFINKQPQNMIMSASSIAAVNERDWRTDCGYVSSPDLSTPRRPRRRILVMIQLSSAHTT